MNVKTRNRIKLGMDVARNMRVRRTKIFANLAVCAMIFLGGFQSGQWSIAIGSMAFVQSVNLPEMVEAYQEARTRPPVQHNEPQQERDKYR